MPKEKANIEAIIGKKYDIKSQISAGGMGEIYLGVHRSLNKRVAIKIIHQEFRKDEIFRRRFHREARMAANLDHPGIVDIYDFGSSEGFDYIIMPFIDGETLKEKLQRDKKILISKSLDLIAAIVSALAFAHKNNVVHRDIKPSNILIDRQGRAHLTDFGISKDLEASELTLPNTVMGSPRYISPEQITGKEIDGRCDLYSLGLIFYEMVTGSYPYAGRNTNAVYYAQVNEVPERPDQANPDIPEAVSDIIMKLIEKLPDNRYQKGSEVLRDIAHVKSGLPLAQSSEAKHRIEIESDAIHPGLTDVNHNKEDHDNGVDDDQPTVINVPREGSSRLSFNRQMILESADSVGKSKPSRFSPVRFILFGSSLVICVVIGYFLLFNAPSQTDVVSAITEDKSVPSPGKSASSNEKQALDSDSSTESIQEDTRIDNAITTVTKSSPDSSEVSLSNTASPKQPTEETGPVYLSESEKQVTPPLPIQPILKKTESTQIPMKKSTDESAVSLAAVTPQKTVKKVSLNSVARQLKTLGGSQEAEFIRLWTNKNTYRIGESIGYHFQASQNCHLVVMLFASSGEIIQVFPNRFHPDSSVSTRNIYNIPSLNSDIKLEVTGPSGIEELFAIISDTPLEVFPFNAEEMPFFVVDETDLSLLERIHGNLQRVQKEDLKHKSFQYTIAN